MVEVIIMIMIFTNIIIFSENQRKQILITKSIFGDYMTSIDIWISQGHQGHGSPGNGNLHFKQTLALVVYDNTE